MNELSEASRRRQQRLIIAAILAVVVSYLAFGLRTASNSLGCDFSAYYDAAKHWFSGQPIYDLSVAATGTCGTYQYPPPFVLLAAPFSLDGFAVGIWLWVAFLIACWVIGTAILPVRSLTRWLILLFGAIGWPLIFGVRIGQVAPILYLLFAIAWRNLDRPVWLGASLAVGTMVKLQPGLLVVWLLVRREWRALTAMAAVTAAIVVVAALLGLWDWVGMVTVLRTLSNATTVPGNVAIGATLFTLGVDERLAGAVQVINTIGVLLMVVLAGLRLPRTPSLLIAIIATQLVSPILWTHYALLLLLPVAWLLDRRLWLAAAIPIALAWVIVPLLPFWVFAAAYYGTLAAVFIVGMRMGREPQALAPMPTLELAG